MEIELAPFLRSPLLGLLIFSTTHSFPLPALLPCKDLIPAMMCDHLCIIVCLVLGLALCRLVLGLAPDVHPECQHKSGLWPVPMTSDLHNKTQDFINGRSPHCPVLMDQAQERVQELAYKTAALFLLCRGFSFLLTTCNTCMEFEVVNNKLLLSLS